LIVDFCDLYLKKLLEAGRLFIIFDSFDETPVLLDRDETSDVIRLFSAKIEEFMIGPHMSRCVIASRLSLPKSRFERTDDVARQGSDAQRRLRTARSGVCRARPSRAKHAFAPRYNRWHISQGFGEGAPR
jgi:hypothetical protein